MRASNTFLIALLFFVNMLEIAPVYADTITLPKPGTMVALSPAFDLPVLKGIKVHQENPFKFEFVLDVGSKGRWPLRDESTRLIKYFLAALTTPEKDLWVNLSPYEKDRIVPESFGQTEMGRDLLAQDYILKQVTASLIYPESEIGKKFWKMIYEEAGKKFGNTNIPVNTFNKVWIVPDKAVIYENVKMGTAYVVQSSLKVMLERDYLSTTIHGAENHGVGSAPRGRPTQDNEQTQSVIREIVIPILQKEINEGKNFAQLRQVYNALILAAWYKKKIKDGILNQIYINQNKIAGVNNDDPEEKQQIYQRYLEAFKKGAYNYIKEEKDPQTLQTMPRKYFSGGFTAENMDAAMTVKEVPHWVPDLLKGHGYLSLVITLQRAVEKGIKRANSPRRTRLILAKYLGIVLMGGFAPKKLLEQTEMFSDDHRYYFQKRARKIYDDLWNTAIEMNFSTGRADRRKYNLFKWFKGNLKRVLENGADPKGLYASAQELSRLQKNFPDDSFVQASVSAWKRIEGVYLLDENSFDNTKPTMLIVHGTGMGPFPMFNDMMITYQKEYNIAFIMHDFREPIDDIANLLHEKWEDFKLKHDVNPKKELGMEMIVATSFGFKVVHHAAMKYPELFQYASLFVVSPLVNGSKIVGYADKLPKIVLNTSVLKPLADYHQEMSPANGYYEELKDLERVFNKRMLTILPYYDHHMNHLDPKTIPALEGLQLFVVEDTDHVHAPSHPTTIKYVEFLAEMVKNSSSAPPTNTGGIDFDPAHINMQVDHHGGGITMVIDPHLLQELKDNPGFTPVIISLTPMTNLGLFLNGIELK